MVFVAISVVVRRPAVVIVGLARSTISVVVRLLRTMVMLWGGSTVAVVIEPRVAVALRVGSRRGCLISVPVLRVVCLRVRRDRAGTATVARRPVVTGAECVFLDTVSDTHLGGLRGDSWLFVTGGRQEAVLTVNSWYGVMENVERIVPVSAS